MEPKAKPGRDFELLVARLEAWLGPHGAVIKSPDSLPDKTDGKPREVDASIRSKIGSSEVLVIVECRDRSGAEDRTWIEQLATKKESVGADKVIAVSSHGFTEGAESKAKDLGIETRCIKDVTSEDAAEWARKTVVTLSLLRWNVRSIKCVVPKRFEPVSFDLAKLEDVKRNPTDAVLGFEKKGNRPLSVRALLDQCIATRRDLLNDVFTSEGVKNKTLTVDFPAGEFFFQAASGPVDAIQMQIALDMWPEYVPPEFTSREYVGTGGTILRVATARVEVEPGHAVDMIMSDTPPSDYIKTP